MSDGDLPLRLSGYDVRPVSENVQTDEREMAMGSGCGGGGCCGPKGGGAVLDDDAFAEMVESGEAVEHPLEPVIDLHTFLPSDVHDLVPDYVDACIEAGFREVRIIHGKGTGVLRELVRKLLERDPRVESFGDAPDGCQGGWGVTIAHLRIP